MEKLKIRGILAELHCIRHRYKDRRFAAGSVYVLVCLLVRGFIERMRAFICLLVTSLPNPKEHKMRNLGMIIGLDLYYVRIHHHSSVSKTGPVDHGKRFYLTRNSNVTIVIDYL